MLNHYLYVWNKMKTIMHHHKPQNSSDAWSLVSLTTSPSKSTMIAAMRADYHPPRSAHKASAPVSCWGMNIGEIPIPAVELIKLTMLRICRGHQLLNISQSARNQHASTLQLCDRGICWTTARSVEGVTPGDSPKLIGTAIDLGSAKHQTLSAEIRPSRECSAPHGLSDWMNQVLGECTISGWPVICAKPLGSAGHLRRLTRPPTNADLSLPSSCCTCTGSEWSSRSEPTTGGLFQRAGGGGGVTLMGWSYSDYIWMCLGCSCSTNPSAHQGYGCVPRF